jgi:hypothetical protein
MYITTRDNDIKERLSVAYLIGVAARAGCQLNEPKIDQNRIDATISAISGSRAKIDIQIKATTKDCLDGDAAFFDLDVPTYDALRSEHVQFAQLLVILHLPKDPLDWLTVDEQALTLRRCAYWKDLRGAPAVDNSTSVRVRLPRSQIFGPDALRDLICRAETKARAGETGL